jgi:hypothetical protein
LELTKANNYFFENTKNKTNMDVRNDQRAIKNKFLPTSRNSKLLEIIKAVQNDEISPLQPLKKLLNLF